jgi:hypothetical protein
MAQRSNVDDIGVAGVDDDATDLPRVMQANVLPSLTTVTRLVNAITRAKTGANVRFSGSRVQDVWIRRSNFQRSDRGDRLPVEHRLPGQTGINGLPDAAIDRAEIKRSSVAWHPGDRRGAAAAKRSDESPLQSAEETRRNRLGGERNVQKKRSENNNDGRRKTSYTMAQIGGPLPAKIGANRLHFRDVTKRLGDNRGHFDGTECICVMQNEVTE